MMLVVVLLLLPVLMTGASLEVPGARCNVQNCCLLAHCHGCGEAAAEDAQGVHGHHHHPHRHYKMLLLNDAGQRMNHELVSVPVVPVPASHCSGLEAPRLVCALLQYTGPPPYGGHVAPLRC